MITQIHLVRHLLNLEITFMVMLAFAPRAIHTPCVQPSLMAAQSTVKPPLFFTSIVAKYGSSLLYLKSASNWKNILFCNFRDFSACINLFAMILPVAVPCFVS